MSSSRPLSIAIDLGATRIKAGLLHADGRLAEVLSVPSPPLRGEDPIREGDAGAYLERASALLARVSTGLPRGLPLGIAAQRSTLVLWERGSGAPVTPLISWLDRRAADWCERHADLEVEVSARTGLRLSPHYAGPKLATLCETRADLRDLLADGRVLFGNLDAWALRAWCEEEAHETDPTIASRTLLADPLRSAWSEELAALFGVPRACLPQIRPTSGRRLPLAGHALLAATVADQAAGAFALLGEAEDVALVNLGTGGFVLRVADAQAPAPRGYLRGPAVQSGSRPTLFLHEGTINGLAGTIDGIGPGPTTLAERDLDPEAFCLPDGAGVGAPHWLPRLSLAYANAARTLPRDRMRRIALEGVVFRVREILEDLFPVEPPRRVLLSGGLARESFVGAALAACLARDVEIVEEAEATLLGAACLAAQRASQASSATTVLAPPSEGAYLPAKYRAWRSWLSELLRTSS